jgi:hypothetical protein
VVEKGAEMHEPVTHHTHDEVLTRVVEQLNRLDRTIENSKRYVARGSRGAALSDVICQEGSRLAGVETLLWLAEKPRSSLEITEWVRARYRAACTEVRALEGTAPNLVAISERIAETETAIFGARQFSADLARGKLLFFAPLLQWMTKEIWS